MKQILSLGAGVQSSVVALMSAAGELPPIDFAVFADTGAEPANVYTWLDWLEGQLPFPVHRVMHNDGLEVACGSKRTSSTTGIKYVRSAVPMWVERDGKMGGALRRDCTRDYKIRPITSAVRRLAGVKRGEKNHVVRQWIGISTDEAHRMKPSRDPWSVHWWPLIDVRMSRKDCLRWMVNKGYPVPPRSSCVFCPFHSAEEWHRLQTQDPAGYAHAVAFEQRMQAAFKDHDEALDGQQVYVQKIVPRANLDTIDWTEIKDTPSGQLDLWGNECEGMCGI